MTIAFAFKYDDEIWAAIDRRVWFDNSYILQDKYILYDEDRELILSSGTAAATEHMGRIIINDYTERAYSNKIGRFSSFLGCDITARIMQDADYNGLIVNKQGIFLIDEKLACFNVGDYWAIGLQHDAARALILSIYHSRPFWMCPEKRSGNQICKDIFSILSKIDYMIPIPSGNEVDIFCFRDNKLNKL